MEIPVSEHSEPLPPSLKTHVYRGSVSVLEPLKDEWRRLSLASTCDTPYNRPEYFETYVKTFEPHSQVVIVTARMDDRLVGLLPLIEAREAWYGIPVRLLATPRDDHYSWFDLICESDIDANVVCESMLRELSRLDYWDVIRIRYVGEGAVAFRLLHSGASSGLRIRSMKASSVPYIPIEPSKGDYNWFFGTRSANFRHMMRKALRRAKAQGGLVLRQYEVADASALQEFYRLEASGWKGEAGTAIICNSHLLSFYNELARISAASGYFRLYLLDVASRPVAGMFAFNLGGVVYFPKIGYDEEFRPFSPGHLLVNAILADLWNSGVHRVDFLGPWMRWKGDWTAESKASWDIHFYRKNFRSRLVEKIRFGLMPVARGLYRRARHANNTNQD